MKKYFLTAAAILLLSPLTAAADIIGTGNLTITANTSAGAPVIGGYYGDYDASDYVCRSRKKPRERRLLLHNRLFLRSVTLLILTFYDAIMFGKADRR